MRIIIESTEKLTDMDGVDVRVWRGVTQRGTKCHVFVHRLAVLETEDQREFERELNETIPPGRKVSLRDVL